MDFDITLLLWYMLKAWFCIAGVLLIIAFAFAISELIERWNKNGK